MTSQTKTTVIHQESTYQMLVESEDKERSAIENFVYLLLVLATGVTIWQFSQEPVTFASLGNAQADKMTALLST
jgi:hypothetical protein